MSPPDNPPPHVFCEDARDDPLASSSERQKNALVHSNPFLKTHCIQMGIEVVEANAISFHGIPRQRSDEATFKFWDDLIGAFVTSHMGTHTRAKCDPNAKRLAFGSADQCCSEVRPSSPTSSSLRNPSQCSNPWNGANSVQSLRANIAERIEHQAIEAGKQ